MIAEICGTTPGGQRIADKDVSIATETGNAFLDTCSAAVVQADDRGMPLPRSQVP